MRRAQRHGDKEDMRGTGVWGQGDGDADMGRARRHGDKGMGAIGGQGGREVGTKVRGQDGEGTGTWGHGVDEGKGMKEGGEKEVWRAQGRKWVHGIVTGLGTGNGDRVGRDLGTMGWDGTGAGMEIGWDQGDGQRELGTGRWGRVGIGGMGSWEGHEGMGTGELGMGCGTGLAQGWHRGHGELGRAHGDGHGELGMTQRGRRGDWVGMGLWGGREGMNTTALSPTLPIGMALGAGGTS